MATKALTSGCIVGAGDVACQTFIEGRSLRGGSADVNNGCTTSQQAKNDSNPADSSFHAKLLPLDYVRLGNMTLLGVVLVAPVLHVWYGFLGRKLPGTSVVPVAGRVLLDQALFAPTFIAVFFSALAVRTVLLMPTTLQHTDVWSPTPHTSIWCLCVCVFVCLRTLFV